MRKLIVTIFLCYFLQDASSQLPPERIHFDNITVADGLPENSVNCMIQDHLGYVWLGTQNGLVRYDGSKLTSFQHNKENTKTLKGKQIRGLTEDKNGDIWIASESIFRFDRTTQMFIEYPEKKTAKKVELNIEGFIHEDKQGFIWVLFANFGENANIKRLDPKTKSWTYFQADTNNQNSFDGSNVFLENYNFGFAEDKNGKIWATTVNKTGNSLYSFNNKTNKFDLFIPDTNDAIAANFKKIGCITLINDGQILLSSIAGEGFFLLNPSSRQVKQFKHDSGNNNSLLSNITSTVYQDRNGFIWISMNEGLDKFDLKNSSFTHYVSVPADPSTPNPGFHYHPVEDRNGNLWSITYNVLDCYNNITGKFTRYENDTKNEGGLKLRFGLVSTLIDNSGLLWVGTDIAGLNKQSLVNRFTLITSDPKKNNSLKDADVTQVYEAPSEPGIIWYGTRTGLEKYDKKTGLYSSYHTDEQNKNSISKGVIRAIAEDKYGRFWVGTATGLNLMDRKKGSFINFKHDPANANSLINNAISVILPASDGKLWIGTDHGLDHFDFENKTFTHYLKGDTSYTPQLFNLINKYTIAERRVAAILHPVNNENKSVPFQLLQPGNFLVTCMGEIKPKKSDYGWIEDASGKILWEIDPNKSFADANARIQADIIYLQAGSYQLKYKSNENFAYGNWSGTPPLHPELWGIQLTKLNTKEAEDFKAEQIKRYYNGLSDNVIFGLTEDSKKNILICTNKGGVSKLDPATGKFIAFVDLFKGPYVTSGSTVEDKKTGNYWVGDYFFGLLLLNKNGEQIASYNTSRGLSSNTVFGIIQDSKGILWISTNNGLCRFDPKTEKMLQFNTLHGLQGAEFNPMSFCNTSDGEIYFGGLHGVNAFYPDQVKIDTIAPKVVLTDLDISGKPARLGEGGQMPVHISIADNITLSYNQNDLTFHFTSIHFTRGDESQFAYKLSPNDKDWVQAGSLRQVRYTDLSPGTYTFKVKAANADGIWAKHGISVTITILPPWWKTWWAYTIYIIGLIAGIFGFIAYRSAALRNENKLLENKVELRTNELQVSLENLRSTQALLIQSEKMASLGELTTGIAHEIQNPLNFVNNFSDLNAELIEEMKTEITKGNMEEVSALANDIGDNEKKITHHGRRAESIVKGMLEHSRTSSGVKEPTDINKLTAECFRLAHHAMKEKDKSFVVNMKTDFDESIGNLNIVSQNIGKVIINVINNAFYTVNEKRKLNIDSYDPSVTVSTKKSGDKVIISVIDNGMGIPQRIVGKIFQPFFTTKPTGEFTGLGLYLSYDIIKAHSGELKVETKEGEGSTFIIKLPVV